ncbi:MAG: hypothetical protein E7409_01180 [Ruminococcaceae bacterium]|nr:hypothetical protein [Oscillospiraceae bacterium]
MDLRNNQITVKELLANPQARALIEGEFPGLLQNPVVHMATNMTLQQVLKSAARFTDQQKLDRVLAQLKAL